MNIKKAERLARSLMDEHGLNDWKFKYDNSKVRFGLCDHSKKMISISFYLTALNDEDEVIDVIKHEIAHAMIGHWAGHGPAWKSTARMIGANDSRTYDSTVVKSPEGRWAAYCPTHGALGKPRHRRTKNVVCRRCRSPIEWRERK